MKIMKKLKSMVEYAYNNSLFYQNLDREHMIRNGNYSFLELPVIEKADLFSNEPIEVLDYVLGRYEEKDIVTMRTSGSTGICLPILWNVFDYNRSMLPLWILRKKYYNINTNDKLCFFYTIQKAGQDEIEYTYRNNTLSFSKCGLNEEKLKNIYMKILEFGPKWMLLQPSIVEILIETALKYNLPPIKELEYIEFSGELLFDETRRKVQNFFNCKISNQYGSYEFNSIAYECKYGNMHCLSSNTYVEILDKENKPVKEGEEGEIVITSLNNKIMPFIR